MNWRVSNNVISELNVNGDNIIKPWGFECADSSSFFSLEDGNGLRYNLLSKDNNFTDKFYSENLVVEMKEGKWKLDISDSIDSNKKIIRYVNAECLEDTIFMDFVMRFRFKKNIIQQAIIFDKEISHNNTNIYYQYPVNKVLLKGKRYEINIKVIDSLVPKNMNPYIYVRDNKDEWVVHIRMLPNEYYKNVIKICTGWAKTRPLPQFISNLLLKYDRLKDFLWYRGENKPQNTNIFLKLFNPSAFPMAKVDRGTRLMWKVRMNINDKENL